MASAMRKMAVYLGLVEDDHRYDDQYQDEYTDAYDEYGADLVQEEERQDAAVTTGGRTGERRTNGAVHTTDLARITTVHPRTYNEARTIGECSRERGGAALRSADGAGSAALLPRHISVLGAMQTRILAV